MSFNEDIETLIDLHQHIQDLIKHNLEIDSIVKDVTINFDQPEIASESIIEICKKLEQALKPDKINHHHCCCSEN